MGKGYNNFMCKKPFHPGSRENLKRVWCAQQKDIDERQKEEEMRLQYEKEQELYNNRLLVSTESKDKLSLNFMYEAPTGAKKERVKEDDEPEYKFEWQRNAPRESFAKGNMEIRDQPFGIQVRNVRCLKCHKWGHVNTDRECPLFSQSSSLLPSASSQKDQTGEINPMAKPRPEELLAAMREDGLALKKNLISQALGLDANSMLLPEQDEDPEMAYLKTLTKEQKKKLLKKLDKLSGGGSKKKKSKDKKHKKHRKRDRSSSSSSSDSDDDRKKRHRKDHESRRERSRSRDRDAKKDQELRRDRSRSKDRHTKDRKDRERSRERERIRDRSRSRERDRKEHRHRDRHQDRDRRDRSRSADRDEHRHSRKNHRD